VLPSYGQGLSARRLALPTLEELRPPPGPRTVVLVVGELIKRTAVPWLCDRVRRLLERGDADLVTCDVADLDNPDLKAIDALARLQLTARRMGRSIRLRHVQAKLEDLLSLTGLGEELPRASMPTGPEAAPTVRTVETDRDRRKSRSH
jgi:ABC-type transporter Mla MlaB component